MGVIPSFLLNYQVEYMTKFDLSKDEVDIIKDQLDNVLKDEEEPELAAEYFILKEKLNKKTKKQIINSVIKEAKTWSLKEGNEFLKKSNQLLKK